MARGLRLAVERRWVIDTNVRVAVIDDHSMFREGLCLYLTDRSNVHVAAQFGSGAEFLAAAPELLIDVALLDISMSGLNGLDTARQVRDAHPHIKIIMLSMYESADYVMQALNAGASGYLFKRSASEEAGKAIETVMRGELYLDSHISRRALENYQRHVRPGESPENILTPRQREILQLMGEGLSTKAIAHRLDLSPKTIESHRAQIMARLNIRDVAGLVRYAIRVGMVPLDGRH